MNKVGRLLVAAVSAASVVSWVATAARADGPQSTTVPTTNEAWYRTAPCATPVGCGPLEGAPAASVYPAGTLHVGVSGGEETDRAYLGFDLGSLPDGVTLTGGTLVVPLDTAAADGSLSPEVAHVAACLVTEPGAPADRAFRPGPPAACASRSAAEYTDVDRAPRLFADIFR